MIVKKGQLYWKSRGFTWDFDTLSSPTKPLTSWYKMHLHVFDDYEDRRDDLNRGVTIYKSGRIILKNLLWWDTEYYYVAAMFRDPTGAKDRAGRPITHFMFLVLEHEWEVGMCLNGWEKEILCQLTKQLWWSETELFKADRAHTEDSDAYGKRIRSLISVPEVLILGDTRPSIRWETVNDFVVPRGDKIRA